MVEKAKLTEKEIEAKVLELGKAGTSSEKIGQELLKQGIKPSDYTKKISQILKSSNLYKSPDIENLKKAIEILKKHAAVHKQDKTSGRPLAIKMAKLRKLEMLQK